MRKLLLLLCLAGVPAFAATCTPATLGGQVAVLQCVDKQVSTSASSITQAYASNNKLGSLLTLVCSYYDSPTVTVFASDSNSNTYTALTSLMAVGNLHMQVFYAANAKAGANTVQCTYSSGMAFNGLTASEYTGVLRSSPLDVSAASSGSSLSAASGSATTTTADLIIGFMNNAGVTAQTSTGGLTMRLSDTGTGYATQDGLQLTAGPQGAAFSITGSGPSWICVMGAFKIATPGAAILLSQ